MKKVYVGSEIAKSYKTYKTLKEANAAAKPLKEHGYYVARLHNAYNRDKFYGYIVMQ